MKHKNQIWTGVAAGAVMILLILDTKTALSGAKEGVLLCIYTVIPSLFPFFVVSCLINSVLLGKEIAVLRPIGKLCGIPQGAESLLMLGLLGGYPVGAQAVTDAYSRKLVTKGTAHRLLGFCSNAGPAFIFGMVSSQFAHVSIAWILWGIHILSALIVGTILPQKTEEICRIPIGEPLSLTQALNRSMKTMANVCGWIVLFRIILAVLTQWILWLLPQSLQVFTTGLLELSNGCLELSRIPERGTRFVLCASFLGFGGLCVGMQTSSAAKDLGTGMYFPGKVLQTLLSFLLAGFAENLVFPHEERFALPPSLYAITIVSSILLLLALQRRKKVVAIPC